MEKDVLPQSRRVPVQSRGQQRVAEILDAAERLIGEQGYEAMTTNHIALAAGVSIGSVYQFFANKFEILQALTQRYLDGMLSVYAGFGGDIMSLAPEAIINRIYDGLLAYSKAHVSFSVVVMSAPPGSELAQASALIYDAMSKGIEGLLAVRAPWMSAEARKIYAIISLTSARALQVRCLAEIRAGNVAFAAQLEQESRALQVAYFNDLLRKHEQGAGGQSGRVAK